ncbi:hypothetical protein EDC96DRAFT_86210 [Choanephora cucurbitarum]|nr:hypothetical protein EDC96DRAFT_86210 [Choanephora cucurbitarum]
MIEQTIYTFKCLIKKHSQRNKHVKTRNMKSSDVLTIPLLSCIFIVDSYSFAIVKIMQRKSEYGFVQPLLSFSGISTVNLLMILSFSFAIHASLQETFSFIA